MKQTIYDVGADTFAGKNVLVRVDFNVPQRADQSISDDSRIKAALPTIKFLSQAGARVILVSHLGRPKGPDKKYTMQPVADRLQALLGKPVKFVAESMSPEVKNAIDAMRDGEICLLENIRFHNGEEKNDPDFARRLASIAHVYVNDAFGTAHRAHASTEGVARYLTPAVAGHLLDMELKALSGILTQPARPFATIIGGSKVSSKIGVLERLVECVDVLVIGGAMAFSFLKAQGKPTGRSLVEDDRIDFCRSLWQRAKQRGVQLILPVDVVCADEVKEGAPTITVSVDDMPAHQMGLDLGPESIKNIEQALAQAKTILWNGPLGVFEVKGFEKSTYALIDILVGLTKTGARTIIGGGDSVAAIEAKGIACDLFTHISTGGGATLEFLEGKTLPGVAVLADSIT